VLLSNADYCKLLHQLLNATVQPAKGFGLLKAYILKEIDYVL